MNKKALKVISIALLLIIIGSLLFITTKKSFKYTMETQIANVNIVKEKNNYLEYLKQFVKPNKLQKFINNGYINLSSYKETATGADVIWELYYEAYDNLFISMFNKSRTDFNDCPVTDNFKTKFSTNLIDYFNLYASENYNVNCSLDIENKDFTIEIYGIEGYSENLEPNYSSTYNFHYTLDDERNVDDIIQKSN